MTYLRLLFTVVLLVQLVIARFAYADGPVQFDGNVDAAVSKARRANLPIFFYVPESQHDERNASNVKRDIWRALRDGRVAVVATQRFVRVKLHRNSANTALFEKFRLGPDPSMVGVLSTPDGRILGKLSQADLCDPQKILERLTRAFCMFRDDLYSSQMRSIVLDRDARPGPLLAALAQVRAYEILSADKDVASLLQRQLSKPVRGAVYETLRTLSTRTATISLIEQALTDEGAVEALGRCLPGSLDVIAAAMNDEFDSKHLVAYHACCRQLKLAPKSVRFWQCPNEKQKSEELGRVRRRAQQVAREWNTAVAPFR